jgi:hypothetical protein
MTAIGSTRAGSSCSGTPDRYHGGAVAAAPDVDADIDAIDATGDDDRGIGAGAPFLLRDRRVFPEHPETAGETGVFPGLGRGRQASLQFLDRLPRRRVGALDHLEVLRVVALVERPLVEGEVVAARVAIALVLNDPRQRMRSCADLTKRRVRVVAGRGDRDHLAVASSEPVAQDRVQP